MSTISVQVARAYLAFRVFQYKKEHNTRTKNREIRKYLFSLNSKSQVELVNPLYAKLDLTRHPKIKTNKLDLFFQSRHEQSKKLEAGLERALSEITKVFTINNIRPDEAGLILSAIEELFYKYSAYVAINPNLYKLAFEFLVLRLYLSDATYHLVDNLLSRLEYIKDYAKPDFLALYYLTGDERFRQDVEHKINIWQYLAAIHGNTEANEKLGLELLEIATALPDDTEENKFKKKYELAVAAYWLGNTSKGRKLLFGEFMRFYSPKVLNDSWFTVKNYRKKIAADNLIQQEPYTRWFIFNEIDVDNASVDDITRLESTYNNLRMKYDFYDSLSKLKSMFKGVFKLEQECNIDVRKRLIIEYEKKLREQLDKNIGKNTKKSSKRRFSLRLVDDECPIQITPFLSFSATEEGILPVRLYDKLTAKKLDKRFGSRGERVYDLDAITETISRYGRDAINREDKCTAPEKLDGKYNVKWLRIFSNIKKLLNSDIIGHISDKWFKSNKIACLLNLEPKLFQPQWMFVLEKYGIDNLTSKDINYINRYYNKFNDLPLEYKMLGCSAVSDYRCDLKLTTISLNLLKIFSKYGASDKRFVCREEALQVRPQPAII